MAANFSLLLVGCGKMGASLLKGWLEAGLSKKSIIVVEPKQVVKLGVKQVNAINEVPPRFVPQVVVFAVKPQELDVVLKAYSAYDKALFLSIAAGKTLETLEKGLKRGRAIVRSMPNLGAMIGQGVTVSIANNAVSKPQKKMAETLLKAVGKHFWVADESMMDKVTMLSGGGPAYFYYFLESQLQLAKSMGFTDEQAKLLVEETVRASLALIKKSEFNLKKLQELKAMVTSPGGTTEAALTILADKNRGLGALFIEAGNQAVSRAKLLNQK